jgi:hypothetical protein
MVRSMKVPLRAQAVRTQKSWPLSLLTPLESPLSGPPCIAHWNLAHTLVALVHAHKQLSRQASHVLLRELPILMHVLQEVDLLHCAQQELKLLKEFVQKKLKRNLLHIFTIDERLDHS